jgi:hypothetical protein
MSETLEDTAPESTYAIYVVNFNDEERKERRFGSEARRASSRGLGGRWS